MMPSTRSTPGDSANPIARSISPHVAVPLNTRVPTRYVTPDQSTHPTNAPMIAPMMPRPPWPAFPMADATAYSVTTTAACPVAVSSCSTSS